MRWRMNSCVDEDFKPQSINSKMQQNGFLIGWVLSELFIVNRMQQKTKFPLYAHAQTFKPEHHLNWLSIMNLCYHAPFSNLLATKNNNNDNILCLWNYLSFSINHNGKTGVWITCLFETRVSTFFHGFFAGYNCLHLWSFLVEMFVYCRFLTFFQISVYNE